MKHGEILPKNTLTSILGMGFITLLMLTISLAWGHLQGRSHEVIDLYPQQGDAQLKADSLRH